MSARRTFSQRFGYEPLPTPMQLEELSNDLRRDLFNELRSFLLSISADGRYFESDGDRFIERVLGEFSKLPESKVSTQYSVVVGDFETIVLTGRFNEVLDFLEILIRDRCLDSSLTHRIRDLFEEQAAAYWLDTSKEPYGFVPRGSIAQGEATQRAIETLESEKMVGATAHLRQAAEHINGKQYADSIADSILAVESVACLIDPESHKTLGPALDALERKGLIKHPALKNAFKALYGYTNDEQGIRHSLLEKEQPEVGLDEALFMFGSCASFAAYLVSKHRNLV